MPRFTIRSTSILSAKVGGFLRLRRQGKPFSRIVIDKVKWRRGVKPRRMRGLLQRSYTVTWHLSEKPRKPAFRLRRRGPR